MTEILVPPVHRSRPEFQESGSWYLLHGNASGVLSEFLARRGICLLFHSLYSPDLEVVDTLISYIKNCSNTDEIRDYFIDRTEKERENWKQCGKKRFLWHSIPCTNDLNVVTKRARTILSGSVNKYCFTFCVWFLMVSAREIVTLSIYTGLFLICAYCQFIVSAFHYCSPPQQILWSPLQSSLLWS
jgi:hypothetical protein